MGHIEPVHKFGRRTKNCQQQRKAVVGPGFWPGYQALIHEFVKISREYLTKMTSSDQNSSDRKLSRANSLDLFTREGEEKLTKHEMVITEIKVRYHDTGGYVTKTIWSARNQMQCERTRTN